MIELTLRNRTQKRGITAAFLRRLFAKTAQAADCTSPHFGVSVSILSSLAMRNLNRKHRNKDKSTDVLSFPLHAKPDKSAILDLGDIFLCPAVIARDARREHTTLRGRETMLAIHGFLHLLGYDHATPRQHKIMFSLQNKILAHFR